MSVMTLLLELSLLGRVMSGEQWSHGVNTGSSYGPSMHPSDSSFFMNWSTCSGYLVALGWLTFPSTCEVGPMYPRGNPKRRKSSSSMSSEVFRPFI